MYKMQIVSTVSNEPSQKNRYWSKLTKINRLIFCIHNFLANNGGNLIEFHMEKKISTARTANMLQLKKKKQINNIAWHWRVAVGIIGFFF